jgi:hypothetical protein
MIVELKLLKHCTSIVMDCAEGGGETAPGASDDSQSSSSLSVGEQKGGRIRRSFEQMAETCAADLEKLKKMDVSSWTEKKRESHASSIELLALKVAADESTLEQNALKRSKSGAGAGAAAPVRSSPMKDAETRRLIYARKVMDSEFEKCINSAVLKWDMVAELFNKGFVAKKRILAGVEDDVEFLALPVSEHITGARGQSKWEKIFKEYRDLMLMKQNVENEVNKRTHMGEKRRQDEILSDVMAEIEAEEKKFKFLADMHACRWNEVAHLNPPPRINSQDPAVNTRTISASSPAPPPVVTGSASDATDQSHAISTSAGACSGSESVEPISSVNMKELDLLGSWIIDDPKSTFRQHSLIALDSLLKKFYVKYNPSKCAGCDVLAEHYLDKLPLLSSMLHATYGADLCCVLDYTDKSKFQAVTLSFPPAVNRSALVL